MSKVDETGDISSSIFFSYKKEKIKNISKLTNLRIIQKQLVYVIGLSSNYAFNEVKIFKFLFSATLKLRVFRTIWENHKISD